MDFTKIPELELHMNVREKTHDRCSCLHVFRSTLHIEGLQSNGYLESQARRSSRVRSKGVEIEVNVHNQ